MQVTLILLSIFLFSPPTLALPTLSNTDPVLESYLKKAQEPEQSSCEFALALLGSGLATSSLAAVLLPMNMDTGAWIAMTSFGAAPGGMISLRFTLRSIERKSGIRDYILLIRYAASRIVSWEGPESGMDDYARFRKRVTKALSRFDLSLLEEKGGDHALLEYVLEFHNSLSIESLPGNPFSAAVRYVTNKMSGFGF